MTLEVEDREQYYSYYYKHCCQNPDLKSKIQDFATLFTCNDSNL